MQTTRVHTTRASNHGNTSTLLLIDGCESSNNDGKLIVMLLAVTDANPVLHTTPATTKTRTAAVALQMVPVLALHEDMDGATERERERLCRTEV